MKFDRFFGDEKIPPTAKQEGDTRRRPEIVGLPEGRWLDDGVYLVENAYRLDEKYGHTSLGSPDGMEVMRRFGATGRTVFLDLETTGLAGGTGTYAFLCGLGFVSGENFRVVQLFLTGPAKERNWLTAIDSFIPGDACIATYNGRAFDLPLLRTRHVLARTVPAWEHMPHIDLLLHARRLYRGILDSCSLGTVERKVLGVRRSGEDIPGYLIPALYVQYLRTRDASPLKGVFYHNELDIVSLAAFYCRVARILEGDCANGHEYLRAGDIWRSMGETEVSERFWHAACGREDSRVEALVRRAFLAKKNMDFAAARDDFSAALEDLHAGMSGSGESVSVYTLLEELAKLEEHRFRSPERASGHVDAALAWLKDNRFLLGGRFGQLHRDMMHRRARLDKKIDKKLDAEKKPGTEVPCGIDENKNL